MMPNRITRYLGLSYTDASELLQIKPIKKILLPNGDTLYKYPSDSEISELQLNSNSVVVNCNGIMNKRAFPRIPPAHLVVLTVEDLDFNTGMIMDFSDTSLKVRFKVSPTFKLGDTVRISFDFPEGGKYHTLLLDTTVNRLSCNDAVFKAVLLFDKLDSDHPFSKYLDCRLSETLFGKKKCERFNRKCLENTPSSITIK